jgi:hypothetical protein
VTRVYAISIGLGIAAAASWAFASTIRPRIEPALDPGEARRLVAADAGARWTAVEARARELAALPRLAAAVATDAATVRDLSADELAPTFRVAPRESVELGQVWGQRAVSLLRAPASAPPAPLARPGRWLSVSGRDLRFTAVASFVPVQDAAAMRGAVAVSTAAPPEVALQQLAARTAGRLVVGGAPVDLGGGLPEDGASVEVALDELPGAPRLILPAAASAPPHAHALRGLGLAALLAGLIAAASGRARSRRSRRPRATSRGMAVAAGVSSAGVPSAGVPSTEAPTVVELASLPVARLARGSLPPPEPAPLAPTRDLSVSGPMAPTRNLSGPLAPTVPPRIGRYQPMALLGEGGTSSVYLARAVRTSGLAAASEARAPEVALKVLRPHLAREERQRAMFLDEARVVSCIDHANVIRILDLGRAEDQVYIAMEHVDGDDLESLLARVRAEGRLVPLPVAVAILRRICAGLHAAHTAADRQGRPLRVVHRDVKPGNVLVSRAGAVKVSDFGLAKARQQAHTSLLGQARGTAAFMAPEQRLGQLVDPRTDVFGVAAIAFELITSLELDLDLARLARFGTAGWPHLPPPRQVRPEVPAALDALVFRGLAFAAADRLASCAEVEAELTRIASDAGWLCGEADVAAWVDAELARRPPRRARSSRRDQLAQGPVG